MLKRRERKFRDIIELINSCHNFSAVAQINSVYVKKRKKKPNAVHSAELGINRHSKLNDGNK
ncbi:hypothetical protein ETG88_18250 [Lelliottia nimipressuralis]|nr:hypothetical protein ETG88_18250 [Lelliottia nimipressuralis]